MPARARRHRSIQRYSPGRVSQGRRHQWRTPKRHTPTSPRSRRSHAGPRGAARLHRLPEQPQDAGHGLAFRREVETHIYTLPHHPGSCCAATRCAARWPSWRLTQSVSAPWHARHRALDARPREMGRRFRTCFRWSGRRRRRGGASTGWPVLRKRLSSLRRPQPRSGKNNRARAAAKRYSSRARAAPRECRWTLHTIGVRAPAPIARNRAAG